MNVAELHADAIARMGEIDFVWQGDSEPPTPPEPDLAGSTWGAINCLIIVIEYAGWAAQPKRGQRERHFWIVECVLCGYRLHRHTRSIMNAAGTRCAVCADAGITERPTLAEAMSAYGIRQRMAATAPRNNQPNR